MTKRPRNPLTEADHARIQELADAGHKAPAIARAIGKNASTVHWYMLSSGLVAPVSTANRPKTYVRKGKTVHLFSDEEDTLITALRISGYSFETIAEQCTKRFNTARTAHSVQVRTIMLAAREDAA